MNSKILYGPAQAWCDLYNNERLETNVSADILWNIRFCVETLNGSVRYITFLTEDADILLGRVQVAGVAIKEVSPIFQEGSIAAWQRKPIGVCPYTEPEQYEDWKEGFYSAVPDVEAIYGVGAIQ